jgi:Glycosyl transferase family group 2
MCLVESAEVACVQASLTIDNTDDSWLSALFTAEYAAQFDLFLPGLSKLRLPMPLGGSSNHFRTEVLREVGAWDPYNVTEDADLGLRLARFGYRSAMIQSTTYEEAPARPTLWLRQRTRWFKGWLRLVQRFNSLHIINGLGSIDSTISHPSQHRRNITAICLAALAEGPPEGTKRPTSSARHRTEAGGPATGDRRLPLLKKLGAMAGEGAPAPLGLEGRCVVPARSPRHGLS